ncbi:MAG: ComEC/Rec2 family competence protein [Bacteroidaceae bacterium]|nr:ComEC/Rec2 family competence protein [Bacteroidaceae bacterium]
MIVRLPLVWASILFIAGIVAGHFWPSVLWLPLVFITLLAIMFCRHRRYAPDVLTVVFWILLGAARICAVGASPEMERESPAMLSGIQARMQQQADRLVVRLQEAGLEGEPLALSAALLLGQRQLLGRHTRQAYSQVGASHLLALSGMHLGIIYGLLYMLLLRWSRHGPWRWHVLPPALLLIWGYALLTGLSLSLVRASVMLSVFTIGTLAERRQPPIHLLALSALVILMCSPLALFDIGFQLSFLAVLFIILIYTPWQQYLYDLPAHWLWEVLGVSLAAWLGTAPLATYYFHTLPLTGFLLNPVLIPMTTAIIYLALSTLLLPMVYPLTWLLTHVIMAQTWIIRQWGGLDCLVLHNLFPPPLAVILIYALLVVFSLRVKATLALSSEY